MHSQEPGEEHFDVVVNEEEQYSIWPLGKEVPLGWKTVGHRGKKADCLAYIKQVWTDMRPLSLRKQMENIQYLASEPVEEMFADTMSPTVKFLSEGSHPLAVYPDATSLQQFISYLEDGFIHLNFLDTKGETCLGLHIDPVTFDKSTADFHHKKGNVHIEGDLMLDYVKVRCIADVDLETLKGKGKLLVVSA